MSENWEKYSKLLKKNTLTKKPRTKKMVTVKETVVAAKENPWFEDEDEKKVVKNHLMIIPTANQEKKIGRYLAIDCEMVGVGPEGVESALARVTIVNLYGNVVMDKYVRPKERVVDYRTEVSGILPEHVENAEPLEVVQKEVAELFKDRIVIGHAIENDLRALFLSHPYYLIRDTSKFPKFRAIAKNKKPALRKLCERFLKRTIQSGSHDSVEDARATMDLYRLVKDEWEAHVRKIKAMKIKRYQKK